MEGEDYTVNSIGTIQEEEKLAPYLSAKGIPSGFY